MDWPTPKEVKDIQKFLGLANYYCQFIKDFVAIARPLHNMVKKDQKWEWIKRKEEAFKELKERFTKELMLVAPDLYKNIRIEVDILCYDLKTLELVNEQNLVWGYTRELNRELCTGLSTLYTKLL